MSTSGEGEGVSSGARYRSSPEVMTKETEEEEEERGGKELPHPKTSIANERTWRKTRRRRRRTTATT